MQKSILVFAVLLVAIIIFTYFSYNSRTSAPRTTTTIVQSTVATTTIAATTTSTSTTTIPQGSCLSTQPRVPVLNGNFSTGTYIGWNQTGGGFGSVPFNLTYANKPNVSAYYNHTWTGYNGTFFASTYRGGIGIQPGNLTSFPFKVTEPYLNFKIISPAQGQIYVQILQNNMPVVTTHYNTNIPGNPYPTSLFLNASIPLSLSLCQNVSIKVVAQVVGGFANSRNYIAIGDFYQGKTPVSTPGIIVNQTIKGING
ncbi:MAG: hypothetical protein KGH71_05770 [Candidatus Micrarchaeota archaeon]|nr:hypothetical protein [Candidatus Micrarchaeota archaeon]